MIHLYVYEHQTNQAFVWKRRTFSWSERSVDFRASYSHGYAASPNDELNFLECEWSDYAVDCMAFQVNVSRARRVEKLKWISIFVSQCTYELSIQQRILSSARLTLL
jgi:hypothetical protein